MSPLLVFVWTLSDIIGLGFWGIIILAFLCAGAWYGVLSAIQWFKRKFL